MLCFAGSPAHPGHSRAAGVRFPVAGLDLELITGSGEEARCTLAVTEGLRAGYRAKNDMDTWFVASYRDRTSCRAVVGAFKIELGNGLLYGNSGRFFCYTRRGSPPRRHVRLAPSLSVWNRQVGAAVSLTARGVSSCVALFEKPGGPAEHGIPATALVAVSSGPRTLQGGAALVASLAGGGDAAGRTARARLYHLFFSMVLDRAFATGEFDLLAGGRYGMVEIGTGAPLRGNLKFFRAPDMNDIGIWDQAIANSRAFFSGMVLSAALGTRRARPRLHLQSTVRSQDTRRLRRRFLSLSLSGKNDERDSWEIECAVRNEYEIEYAASAWASGPATAITRDVRVRSTLQTGDRRCRHTIRADLAFDRPAWKPRRASAAVETRVSRRWLTITGKIQSWALQPGDASLLSRPGVGSFEYWSMIVGQGSDLCIRARIALKSDLSITCFFGRPWKKSGTVYTAIRWKF